MEWFDFTQNSQTTINRTFADFPCITKTTEHGITEHYDVEVDFEMDS